MHCCSVASSILLDDYLETPIGAFNHHSNNRLLKGATKMERRNVNANAINKHKSILLIYKMRKICHVISWSKHNKWEIITRLLKWFFPAIPSFFFSISHLVRCYSKKAFSAQMYSIKWFEYAGFEENKQW